MALNPSILLHQFFIPENFTVAYSQLSVLLSMSHTTMNKEWYVNLLPMHYNINNFILRWVPKDAKAIFSKIVTG
jgi:hypothetical protein